MNGFVVKINRNHEQDRGGIDRQNPEDVAGAECAQVEDRQGQGAAAVREAEPPIEGGGEEYQAGCDG